MKKKTIYTALCFLLVCGALVCWDSTPKVSEMLHCSPLWFDALTGGLGLGAIICSITAGESGAEAKSQK